MLGRFGLLFLPYFCLSEVIQIGKKNKKILKENEVVIVNFYIKECKFSESFNPIIQETAVLLAKSHKEQGKVAVAKVDCEAQAAFCKKYEITKYPTVRFFKYGYPIKKEYRGDRHPIDFKIFVDKLLKLQVLEFRTLEQLKLDDWKHKFVSPRMVGYFNKKESESYMTFKRVAAALKSDCVALASFGDQVSSEMPNGENIIFKDKKDGHAHTPEAHYGGENQTSGQSMTDFEAMYAFFHDKCVAMLREITFENGEELTEEGKPFLVLFHGPKDYQSAKDFGNEIFKSLMPLRDSVNFVHAKCDYFEQALQHVGKSPAECPVIAIDGFDHMYLFQDYGKAYTEKNLLNFVNDFKSGKLHKDYHAQQESIERSTSRKTANELESDCAQQKESIFKNLKPSTSRYSMIRDEL